MAIVKISCKDINDKKITLELEESAIKGDHIVLEKDQLNSFECVVSWIDSAVSSKHRSDVEKIKRDYMATLSDKIKAAKNEQKLETEKQFREQYKIKEKEFQDKIDAQNVALIKVQEACKHAAEQYKTNPEYLKILSDLEIAHKQIDDKLKVQASELSVKHLKSLGDKDAEINHFKELLSKSREEFMKEPEYQKMKKDLEELRISLASISDKHKSEIDLLNNDINLQKRTHEIDIIKIKDETDKATRAALKKEQEDAVNKAITEQNQLIKELLDSKDKQIEDLKVENQVYKDRRSVDRNMKKLGSDFEIWCKDIIESAFEDDSFIRIGRVSSSMFGERPDIVVEFLKRNKEVYKKATIECKTQAHNGSGHYKNESFIEKLKKDAKNNKSALAILVTELESRDDFTFRKHKDSTDDLALFVCRPDFLVEILRLYNIFYKKEAEMQEDEGIENKYKNQISEKFLTLFNDFQEKIEKATERLIKKSDEVNKHLTNIIQTSEKAQEVFNAGIKDKISKLLLIFEKFNPKFDSQFQKLLKSNIDLLFVDELTGIIDTEL